MIMSDLMLIRLFMQEEEANLVARHVGRGGVQSDPLISAKITGTWGWGGVQGWEGSRLASGMM